MIVRPVNEGVYERFGETPDKVPSEQEGHAGCRRTACGIIERRQRRVVIRGTRARNSGRQAAALALGCCPRLRKPQEGGTVRLLA